MVDKKISKDEEVGYHKGAIYTLMNERNGLAQMIGIVEQLLQAHIKSLKDLGIDIVAELKANTDKAKEKLDEKLKQ
ncbi:hypothetical protein HY483_00260 [Candidatus Woesearchaeota archaeon]|nr:hypothetical protein [Candidatus Woesearchaeota archaeon]